MPHKYNGGDIGGGGDQVYVEHQLFKSSDRFNGRSNLCVRFGDGYCMVVKSTNRC